MEKGTPREVACMHDKTHPTTNDAVCKQQKDTL
jgi:hypothetical protein